MLVTRGEASACCQEDVPLVLPGSLYKKRHGSTVAGDLNSNALAFPSSPGSAHGSVISRLAAKALILEQIFRASSRDQLIAIPSPLVLLLTILTLQQPSAPGQADG